MINTANDNWPGTKSIPLAAARFARAANSGQKRKYTGAPYILHPCRVAGLVATHEVATDPLVAAAFLHDVVEDCGCPLAVIQREFSGVVAGYVDWLTNKSKEAGTSSRAERKRLDRERLKDAPREVKVVKLIDRLDNLLEVPAEIDPDFAELYAGESLLLVEAIGDADEELAQQVRDTCEHLQREAGKVKQRSRTALIDNFMGYASHMPESAAQLWLERFDWDVEKAKDAFWREVILGQDQA